MRNSMHELEHRYDSLKSVMKSKYETQIQSMTNEWRGEKEAVLDLVENECRSIVKKVEGKIAPILDKASAFAVDMSTSPSRIVSELFSNFDKEEGSPPSTMDEDESTEVEESFEEIEDFVVGILNSCGGNK